MKIHNGIHQIFQRINSIGNRKGALLTYHKFFFKSHWERKQHVKLNQMRASEREKNEKILCRFIFQWNLAQSVMVLQVTSNRKRYTKLR